MARICAVGVHLGDLRDVSVSTDQMNDQNIRFDCWAGLVGANTETALNLCYYYMDQQLQRQTAPAAAQLDYVSFDYNEDDSLTIIMTEILEVFSYEFGKSH